MNSTAQSPAAEQAALDIGIQRLVGLVEVALDGSLDEGTVELMREAIEHLLGRGATDIELDLTELVELDGYGLALLLEVHRHLEQAGGELVLRHAQPVVLRRLRAAALDDVLIVAA